MTQNTIKRLIENSYPVRCCYYCLSDWWAGKAYRAGRLTTESGSTHAALASEQSVTYINGVFGDYKKYSDIEKFSGRVAEIGPGDNCGVGLLFASDGCTAVDLVDRFYSKREPIAHAKIYEALIKESTEVQTLLKGVALDDEDNFPKVRRWYGPQAAAEVFFQTHTGYDFIVSRAVFEHLYDPISALSAMAKALNPGGLMLHKVDLRDHGMFSKSFHELKFLEVPDILYRRMTTASGKPNRLLANKYRDCLNSIGLDYTLLVTRLAGVGEINPHVAYEEISLDKRKESISYVRSVRSKFAKSLRMASDEDLSIAGLFIVAKKIE